MATLFAAGLLIAAPRPVTASAAGADLAGLIVFQDTTVVTDSTRLQRLMRGRARRDSLTRRARVADGDTLQEAGLPFPEPDSIMRALMRRQGYRPVFYQGDTLRLVPSENSIHINERAFLRREGDQLYADSVVYNSDTRYMVAFGKSKLIDAKGQEMVSEKGPFFYNTDRHLGTVVGGKTKWSIWNVEGNFTLEGSDTLWVNHGIFTSCENPEPHYYFQAGRMKLIFNKIVVAWPVKLYFGDTPVFWFPFFAQDIRQGRHSGILTPRFGVNDIFRQDRDYRRHISNVGYYWAINDYMDGQLAIDWWSETWFRIDTFFRYNWRRKFMTGRFGFSRFLLPDRRRETSLVWNHSQKFGERANLRASVQFVSSTQFERENEFNPERLTQQIRSNIGFTRRFDWGNLNLSAERIQPLTEGEQTVFDLPQLSVTLNPIRLTKARTPLEKRWYHGLTLTGNGSFNNRSLDNPDGPDQSLLTSSLSTGLTLGRLRWSGSGAYREDRTDAPDTLIVPIDTMIVNGDTITADTMVLGPDILNGLLAWSSGFGYNINLIGSTTLTPGLSLDGSFFRSNQSGRSFVAAPTRIRANASLVTDIYGFFPGVGAVQRIRHKFSPSFRWNYSPAVKASQELQDLIGFSVIEVAESHSLSVGLNQTFEAKLKPKRVEGDEDGDPPEGRKITVLALRTSSLSYDFVRGRVTTTRIDNSASSDLLRGLTVRLSHDLFENTEGGRKFSPFLSSVSLGFSIGDRSFRGFFQEPGSGVVRTRGIRPEIEAIADEDTEDILLEDEEEEEPREKKQRRPWSASFDYSLLRARPGESVAPNQQTLRVNLGFSPTDNWTVSWRTTYDIERGEFVDQIVSLRRNLHRWAATFDFLQAANDNFTFEFRVSLNDLPDVKFDWRTETRR